jgi:hypothetical protein
MGVIGNERGYEHQQDHKARGKYKFFCKNKAHIPFSIIVKAELYFNRYVIIFHNAPAFLIFHIIQQRAGYDNGVQTVMAQVNVRAIRKPH